MALVLADRVSETTATAGSGTVTLLGAAFGYQSFAVIGNGNQTYYVIAHQSIDEWEVGIGTYDAITPSLSRDTVLSSSNGGAKITFSAGTKKVFVDYPSEKAVYEDLNNDVTVQGNITADNGILVNATVMTSSFTISSGHNGLSVGPFTIGPGGFLTVAPGQRHLILT